FFFPSSPPPRDLHSFPTRRSSDLLSSSPYARQLLRTLPASIDSLRDCRHSGGRDCCALLADWLSQTDSGQALSLRMRNDADWRRDRKSTRLNSSHVEISYAVFCLK